MIGNENYYHRLFLISVERKENAQTLVHCGISNDPKLPKQFLTDQ